MRAQSPRDGLGLGGLFLFLSSLTCKDDELWINDVTRSTCRWQMILKKKKRRRRSQDGEVKAVRERRGFLVSKREHDHETNRERLGVGRV